MPSLLILELVLLKLTAQRFDVLVALLEQVREMPNVLILPRSADYSEEVWAEIRSKAASILCSFFVDGIIPSNTAADDDEDDYEDDDNQPWQEEVVVTKPEHSKRSVAGPSQQRSGEGATQELRSKQQQQLYYQA